MERKEIRMHLILGQNSELIEALDKLENAESYFIELFTKIQNDCEHAFQDNFKNVDPFKNILGSKTCTFCGFTQQKPKGMSWEVCERCWHPMEYKGRTPGQGDGVHVYECTNCKNVEEHP